MGVRRAVDMVLYLAEHKEKEHIYTYGPLIHNPQTVELLKQRGIIPIERIAEIRDGIVVIRAHGISPEERTRIAEKGVKIIDATCPKVVHVQSIIKRHASEDCTILIIGDREHPEVEGLLGHALGKGIVIGNRKEAELIVPREKLCVVAQTTQSKDEYAIISRIIADRCPGALIFDTICDSTERRQAEVKKLASEMDVVFIIGGLNSANTRRLAKISESQGTPTFHIETADDLKSLEVNRFDRIGISAGASTPNWIIKQIVNFITKKHPISI
jgi:4-hydroxy-3-methylbut-2-enyl diphosphate reductase